MEQEAKPALKQIQILGADTDLTLQADAYAFTDDYNRQDTLLLASVAGPERVIRALNGVLHSNNTKTKVEIGWQTIEPSQHGYRIYKQMLDEETRTWHALVIAKDENFLPVYNEIALWQYFRQERFTTPMLQSWLPWLAKKIKAHAMVRLSAFGCEPAYITEAVSTANLDNLICSGLQKGEIYIG